MFDRAIGNDERLWVRAMRLGLVLKQVHTVKEIIDYIWGNKDNRLIWGEIRAYSSVCGVGEH